MSAARYEQYKDALRRGHVAAMRGHRVAAIDAYSEAATIAPDRALPLVSLGGVLVQLGRTAEALAAFDAALDRAPADEPALRSRADLLIAAGDRSAAADALDRLAATLERADRLPEATDAARRALELAESRSRRRSVSALTDRLRRVEREPGAAEALTKALDILEGRGLARHDGPIRPDVEAETSSLPDVATVADPVVPAAPVDPAAATAAVEAAAESGDAEATVVAALAAAAGHRASGSVVAAIDAIYLALAMSPAEPRLHLTLVELYLDRGWRPLAVEKLLLLRTLAGTADDQRTLDAIAAVVARLPDEPRLAPAAG